MSRQPMMILVAGPSTGTDRMVAIAKEYYRIVFHQLDDIPDLTS
ncbi:MAG TPA: hypothetical protein VF920_12150 [Dongiaceae bacterium]